MHRSEYRQAAGAGAVLTAALAQRVGRRDRARQRSRLVAGPFTGSSTGVDRAAYVYRPDAILWQKGYWIAGPSETFSKRVISICERLLKELVNDWSAAQTDNE